MTIADTVPYATVLESSDYFDSSTNHMYCDDWNVGTAGTKAQVTTNMSLPLTERLTFVAKDVGIAGNLVSVECETGTGPGGALTIVVTGTHILIQQATGGSATYQIRTLMLADPAVMALLSDVIKYGNVAYTDHSTVYLSGGTDPYTVPQLPALCEATRKIDGLNLAGKKKVSTQVNQFPRIYIRPDGTEYEQSAVPEDVKQACCEEALAILKYGNTARYKLKTEGVSNFTVGAISETFDGKVSELLSREAARIMKKYLAKSYVMRR
jgi:hypothetical protein